MQCKHCQTALNENAKFCPSCGMPVDSPSQTDETATYQAPPKIQDKKETLPKEYQPLGSWTYYGLRILFTLPLVGFIFLILFTFSKSNIHRREFAISYWYELAISVIIILLTVALCFIFATLGFGLSAFLEELFLSI